MEAGDNLSSGDSLEQRHKQERKELQGKIQQLKHGVSKGDKKKKKEVTEEIARLEDELDQRQEEEIQTHGQDSLLAQTGEPTADPQVSDAANRLDTLMMDNAENVAASEQPRRQKISKAQKRRAKKAEHEKERADRCHAQEIENLSGPRYLEQQKLKNLLKDRGLKICEIASDGNCLYNAISHQLQQRNIQSSNENLRQRTADYLQSHMSDFLPFLVKEGGDIYTTDEFYNYCDELVNTPSWGGQLEIQALSKVLGVTVEIVQAEGSPIVVGESEDKAVVLVYHRHAYGLGAHYNSVIEITGDSEDEES